MSKPVESFFDVNDPNYRFWELPSADAFLDNADIIFQGPLLKYSKKTKQLKERYFVLTNHFLFYIKSEKENKILAFMRTLWVRTDFIKFEVEIEPKTSHFCIRFVRNLKYTDLFADDEDVYNQWKKFMSPIFVQSNFHEKFQTVKAIGKGSFAKVYLVFNKDTKERFAVKAFSKEQLLAQPKGRDSVINEISIMKKLKHPNIMNLEEVHESKNSLYLVVELLEGGELLNYISSRESLTSKEINRVISCILEAVAYMSSKNIMHRDLKPDNMILKEKSKLETCVLKIVDFGLATEASAQEYLFKRCGTPGFVAPEVINAPSNENVHYSTKCDVFSAGIILYILITERSPFEGKSFEEILKKNKTAEIDFKHPRLKKNKVALELLRKMLEPDPNKRISAKEALKDPYFEEDPNAMLLERGSVEEVSNFKNFEEDYKALKGEIHKRKDFSIVVREAAINGLTDSYHDSVNSDNKVFSLKSMSSPKKPNSAQNANILKLVLEKNSQTSLKDMPYEQKLTELIFESEED